MSIAIHVTLTALFLVMMAIQLNDPDPALWVILYLSIAAVPAARLFKRRVPALWGVALGLAVACLALSFPGFIEFLASGDYAAIGGEMMADKPYVESGREFLGTLIGVGCLAGYYRWHNTRQPE